MTESEYVKPELYLYIQFHNSGGTHWMEVHIVKEQYNTYHHCMQAVAVDSYDFTKGEYETKDTRYFKYWSPYLRYFNHDGEAYNYSEPQYGITVDDFLTAERIYKTLSSFSKGFERITKKRGHTVDFIETILRWGELCGVVGLIIPDENYSHTYEYKKWSLEDARWVIKDYFKSHGWTKGWAEK